MILAGRNTVNKIWKEVLRWIIKICLKVLESLQRVLFYVQVFEKQFVQEQLDKSSEEQRKELAKKRRELAKSEKRID